jgi:flagellin-like hook-associated protein FlgL
LQNQGKDALGRIPGRNVMVISIQNNISALTAQRHLQESTMIDRSLATLPSGYHISYAGDDVESLKLDVDTAAETKSMTRAQIFIQAGMVV